MNRTGKTGPDTFFDTAARTPTDTLDMQREALAAGAPHLTALLEAFPAPAGIVNADREILVANDRLHQLAGRHPGEMVGRRLGEVLDCIHGLEEPSGCGTTEACAWCGAAQALRGSRLLNRAATSPCRIVRASGADRDALNADVTCTPVAVDRLSLTIVAIQDVSDRERRHVLERMFFHDVLNSVGALQGLMDVWPDLTADEAAHFAPTAARLTAHLVEEIQAHRDLLAAEDGTLAAHLEAVVPSVLASDVCALYATHRVADGKRLFVDTSRTAPTFKSDPVLLWRVLGNLVKNALEASAPGQVVTVRYEAIDGGTRFTVHNQTSMSPAVRLQVFQRAYSTKGRGRGLGTYGARLIAERYLGGSLTFTSAPDAGTVFQLDLPR